jgi:hypothetical protein
MISFRLNDELDSWGLIPGRGFSLFQSPVFLGPTQSTVQRIQGTLSLGVKMQGCESDVSPLSSAEVKKMELYLYFPYTFVA